MSVLKEFREFINKGNVVDLAVAVVIGGAFGKIVSALVADLVMPLVNSVMPQGDWRKWEVTPLHFRVGDFMGTIVDFTIVAFVVFIVMVKLVGKVNKKAVATRTCPECLESVPVAAKRCRACTSVLTALALLLMFAAPSPAAAQTNPAFVFAKPDEAKAGAPPAPPADKAEWKAQVKAGTTATSGNSQTVNATAGVSVSRKQNANKFAFDAAAAYGESNIIVPVFADAANPTTITNVERRSTTTTSNWLSKARYDRFFTANNAGYASSNVGADRIAGKSLIFGGQVGYSRQLIKNATHTLVSELGYDYSREHYVPQPMRTLDPVSIHSARLFVGETMKLGEASALSTSIEAFLNLNREGAAIDAQNRTVGVEPFHDTRIIGKVNLTTTLWKRLGVGFGFTVRFDQNPAPRPIPSGSPAGSMYSADFPFANRTDTLGELTLIYTFI
jgi:large conductance mechanosensitive channel